MNRLFRTRPIATMLGFAALCFTATAQAQQSLPAGDDAIGLVAGNQSDASVSFNGSGYLVVWSDNRSNPYGTYEYETSQDIYGIRLDLFGNPIETVSMDSATDEAQRPLASFPIYQGKGAQSKPRISWNGSMWLVVFDSVMNNGTGYYASGIQAVRVSGQGQVLDQKPITFFGLKPAGYPHVVGTDGNNWIVVNQGNAASGNTVAMRVSPQGVVLDPPTRIIIPETYFLRYNYQLAYAGGRYMLLCTGEYGQGQNVTDMFLFDSNLNMISTQNAIFDGPTSGLASNGSQFFVSRMVQQPDFSMAMTGTRLTTSGVKVNPSDVVLSGLNSPTTGNSAVAWDGSAYRVFWETASGTRVGGMTPNGTVLNSGGLPVAGLNVGPVSSNLAGGYALASTQYNDWNNDIVTQFVNPSFAVGPQVPASIASARHTRPDIAKGNTSVMTVYLSETAAQQKIIAQLLDSHGNQVGGPRTLATTSTTVPFSAPQVASNGNTFLVTWGDNTGVKTQRLNSSGALIGAPQLTLASHIGPASVAAQGDVFLVVARRYGSTPQYLFSQAVRMRGSDGAVLDPSPILIGGNYVSRKPVVTAHNGGWLIGYLSNWTHNASNADGAIAFLPSSGVGLQTVGTHNFSTAGGNGVHDMAIASNGTRALFVISQELTSGVETDLRAQFIDGNVTLVPAFNITPWKGNQYRPDLTWNGSHFVLTYQDQKFVHSQDALEQLDARSDVMGMRIAPAGSVLDPDGFVVSGLDTSESDPAVLSLNSKTLFVWAGLNNGGYYQNYRIHTASLGIGANKWPVARILASDLGGDVPVNVSFSSAGTFDPDGDAISYFWQFGDGATSTLPNPSHTYTTAGPHRVKLFVRDSAGNRTQQNMLFEAALPNVPPVAAISNVPSSGTGPMNIEARAENSYDPDGQLGNTHWLFDGTTEYYGSVGYHTFETPGAHTIQLQVWDNLGSTTIITKTVTVN